MKHLPRLCNHCLNPACVAACPSGAIYKRDEDGVVLISQDGCRGWRHCVPACPYKKIYYNWETNKAEKCVFCFPRLENGLPTVCSDGCVGRMRYLGVLLYDADKVKAAASTPDPKDIYKAYLDALCDPNDPATVKAAQEAGIPDRWIRAAQNSPSYQLIAEWQLAFPLHPEYRTLPNVWYVPPLSPIARRAEEKVFFPGAAEMRIPVAYLAQLLTAGDTAAIERVLGVLLELRTYMRTKQTGEPLPAGLTHDAETYEAMYRLLGIAKRRDRFNIPAGVQDVSQDKLRELQGSAGYACPGGC